MTYDEAVKYIDSLLVFGSRPGLERVRELSERLGSPHLALKFVHVAGTNGKGSVCADLASILQAAGYKTGLFISPYVLEFRERFQINGRMIPPSDLASIVEEVKPVVSAMKDEGKIITEFEVVLVTALLWYAREKCDVVVLETGLGGRFDATNIIETPLASVIMSISLDHTAILGDTCEKIAFEKCGIIKPGGTTVLYGQQPDGVYDVVKSTAAERNNRLLVADPSCARVISSGLTGSRFVFSSPVLNGGRELELSTPLVGSHQVSNAAAALFTIAALRDRGLSIPDSAIEQGLARVSFPARLEMLCGDPVVLLDGAHNPGGAAALSDAVCSCLSGRKKTAVVGMLADKDVHSALSLLVPLFDRVLTLTPDNPRAMSAQELCGIVSSYGVPAQALDDKKEAVRLALSYAFDGEKEGCPSAVVVFGSLYLASELRPIILDELKKSISD